MFYMQTNPGPRPTTNAPGIVPVQLSTGGQAVIRRLNASVGNASAGASPPVGRSGIRQAKRGRPRKQPETLKLTPQQWQRLSTEEQVL